MNILQRALTPAELALGPASKVAVISSHKSLIAKAALIAAKHPLNVPRPPHWGGYLVIPDRIEFWQGRPSRLHDRICYLYNEGKWERERLSPKFLKTFKNNRTYKKCGRISSLFFEVLIVYSGC